VFTALARMTARARVFARQVNVFAFLDTVVTTASDMTLAPTIVLGMECVSRAQTRRVGVFVLLAGLAWIALAVANPHPSLSLSVPMIVMAEAYVRRPQRGCSSAYVRKASPGLPVNERTFALKIATTMGFVTRACASVLLALRESVVV